MTKFVANFTAEYSAADEVSATVIGEIIAQNAMVELDADEGDCVELVQITSFGLDLPLEEVIPKLRVTRNLLIKTRFPPAYALAAELDKVTWALEHGDETMSLAGYDYSTFLEVALSILKKGDSPNV